MDNAAMTVNIFPIAIVFLLKAPDSYKHRAPDIIMT